MNINVYIQIGQKEKSKQRYSSWPPAPRQNSEKGPVRIELSSNLSLYKFQIMNRTQKRYMYAVVQERQILTRLWKFLCHNSHPRQANQQLPHSPLVLGCTRRQYQQRHQQVHMWRQYQQRHQQVHMWSILPLLWGLKLRKVSIVRQHFTNENKRKMKMIKLISTYSNFSYHQKIYMQTTFCHFHECASHIYCGLG